MNTQFCVNHTEAGRATSNTQNPNGIGDRKRRYTQNIQTLLDRMNTQIIIGCCIIVFFVLYAATKPI